MTFVTEFVMALAGVAAVRWIVGKWRNRPLDRWDWVKAHGSTQMKQAQEAGIFEAVVSEYVRERLGKIDGVNLMRTTHTFQALYLTSGPEAMYPTAKGPTEEELELLIRIRKLFPTEQVTMRFDSCTGRNVVVLICESVIFLLWADKDGSKYPYRS